MTRLDRRRRAEALKRARPADGVRQHFDARLAERAEAPAWWLARTGGPVGMEAGMAGEALRWVSYDEAADLLGLPAEAVKRLALRRSWPRRSGPAGATLVAVPEAIPGEIGDDPDEVEVGRGGGRSLLDYLEAHVERLTEELAEARTEMRGVRYEAESLRVEAGRTQVFAALIEAERVRSAEIRAERDSLADELARCRQSWIVRVLRPLLDRRAIRTPPKTETGQA